MDTPASSPRRDTYTRPRTASSPAQSDGEYYSTSAGGAPTYGGNNSNNNNSPTMPHGGTKDRHSKLHQPRWFKQVKDWVSVSEPSAQAMKDQRRTAYRKHGVAPNDPQAAAKMHLPIGKVPAGVTTSTRGPEPEEALRRRVKDNAERRLYTARSGSQSASSGMSSNASTREARQIAPWV